MTEEQIERIFTPFQQADNSTSRRLEVAEVIALNEELSALCADLAAWLASRASDVETTASHDEAAAGSLNLLMTQLENQQLDAIDSFQNLKAFLRKELGEQDFIGFERYVETLNFQAALRMFTTIIKVESSS